MLPLTNSPNRCSFAPPALPGINATMSTSDFRLPMPAPLHSIACRRVRRSAAPADGSPRFTRTRTVRLDAACDPGSPSRARHDARSGVACRRCETVGRFQLWVFRGLSLHGQLHLLPLHLVSFRAYASTGLLPVPAARLDTRPVASGYLGGTLTHSNTRPCRDAPQRTLRKAAIRSQLFIRERGRESQGERGPSVLGRQVVHLARRSGELEVSP